MSRHDDEHYLRPPGYWDALENDPEAALREAAERAIQSVKAQIANTVADNLLGIPNESDDGLLAMLIDWGTFWKVEHGVAEWLAEPIIPAKRATALFAPGGTGKSLLSLFIASSLATGTDPFSGRPVTPVRVLYLDYEMTDDDVAERLEAMGYGESSDLSNFRYALLPSLPGMDTPEGGKAVVRLAQLVDAELVIIDTFGRAVVGDENDADTVRAFYRWTGLHLKHEGRAFVRVDHAGKDLAKGQRGTSAKNDDVDVVWQMTKRDGGYRLSSHIKRRMSWVPEKVDLTVSETNRLRFGILDDNTYPVGTVEVAKNLDGLGAPADVSTRAAGKLLSGAGKGARNELVRAAVKYRKMRSSTYHLAGDKPVDNTPPSAPEYIGARSPETDWGADRDAWADAEIDALVDEAGRGAGRSGAR